MIKIIDWSGNILFEGHHTDKTVDAVLDANRCDCRSIALANIALDDDDDCKECNGIGYATDFRVEWVDETNETNVYEFINY